MAVQLPEGRAAVLQPLGVYWLLLPSWMLLKVTVKSTAFLMKWRNCKSSLFFFPPCSFYLLVIVPLRIGCMILKNFFLVAQLVSKKAHSPLGINLVLGRPAKTLALLLGGLFVKPCARSASHPLWKFVPGSSQVVFNLSSALASVELLTWDGSSNMKKYKLQ